MSYEQISTALTGIENGIKGQKEQLIELHDRVFTLEQKGGSRPNTNKDDFSLADPLQGMRVLRTAKDFREHYRQPGSEDGGRVLLADIFRGIAGMKTTQAATKALSIGTDTAGGHTVPTVLMPGILEAMVASSATLTAGAGIVPVDAGKTFTTAAVDTVPTPAWRAEAGAVAESDPVFRSVVATPRSLSVYFKMSRELLADGQNLEEALRMAVGQAYAKAIDLAGLRGSGTAPTPRGILSTPNVIQLGSGANGSQMGNWSPMFALYQLLLEADSPAPTAAIMSPRSLLKTVQFFDTTTQLIPRPPLLDQLRFIPSTQIPNNLTVGTSTDCTEIYLGDFTKLMYVLREGLSIELLRERYAENGQVAFMCHARVDVAVLYPKAFGVLTGIRN